MIEPKELEICEDNLILSHVPDTKKCRIMASGWGESGIVNLNKKEVKRVVKWLNKWLEFNDANCTTNETEDKVE